MKVLFLNTQDAVGGAARAAMRLSRELTSSGVDCSVLVQQKSLDDPRVVGPNSKLGSILAQFRPHLDHLPLKLYAKRTRLIFSPACVPDGVARQVRAADPDIVNLHWVCDGFLRIESLARFNKPIVWTLHDSWAFTGGCHLPFGCTRYRERCGACPQLGSPNEQDLSRKTWKRKQKSWEGLGITVVSPSRWLADCARSSALFRDARIEVIPNGVDLERFKPFEKGIARGLFTLPQDKKVILFGGVAADSDHNKGFEFLRNALRDLAGSGWGSRAEVVIFGAAEPRDAPDFGMKAHYMGRIHDEIALSLLYAAADVLVLPSIQENLPNTVMESMACATPCVAFRQGGLPDLIQHKGNGYLARPFEPADLAAGIAWVLEDASRWERLSAEARSKAVEEFGIDKSARCYEKLYKELVNG